MPRGLDLGIRCAVTSRPRLRSSDRVFCDVISNDCAGNSVEDGRLLAGGRALAESHKHSKGRQSPPQHCSSPAVEPSRQLMMAQSVPDEKRGCSGIAPMRETDLNTCEAPRYRGDPPLGRGARIEATPRSPALRPPAAPIWTFLRAPVFRSDGRTAARPAAGRHAFVNLNPRARALGCFLQGCRASTKARVVVRGDESGEVLRGCVSFQPG